MKKAILFIYFSILMSSKSFGQYKTIDETIKYINQHLKDYTFSDLNRSNLVSIDQMGQLKLTWKSEINGSETIRVSTVNIKDLQEDFSSTSATPGADKGELSFQIKCANESDCVTTTTSFNRPDNHSNPSRTAKYLTVHFSDKAETQKIINAFKYLIVHSKSK